MATISQPTAKTVNAPKAKTAKTTGTPAKAKTTGKAKVNPLRDSRKAMLAGVREERASLTDCLRLLAMKGHNWLKALGVTPKDFGKLTPNDLRPYQKESERYRAVINEGGDLEKVETGWTPAKVANAVERMYAPKVAVK